MLLTSVRWGSCFRFDGRITSKYIVIVCLRQQTINIIVMASAPLRPDSKHLRVEGRETRQVVEHRTDKWRESRDSVFFCDWFIQLGSQKLD